MTGTPPFLLETPGNVSAAYDGEMAHDLIANLEALLTKGGDGAALRLALASRYLDAGDAEAAVRHAEAAVRLDPEYSAAWKALLSYLIIDQAYAEAITRFERGEVAEHARRWYFLGVTLPIVAVWLSCTVGGVYLGSWVAEGWSLDFVLPLVFIALAVPAVKNRATGAAALFAGVTALFAASMPLNLGLLTAAFVGVSGGLVAESVIGRRNQ